MVAVNKKTAGEIKAQHDALEELKSIAQSGYDRAVSDKCAEHNIDTSGLDNSRYVNRVAQDIVKAFETSELEWSDLKSVVFKEGYQLGSEYTDAVLCVLHPEDDQLLADMSDLVKSLHASGKAGGAKFTIKRFN